MTLTKRAKWAAVLVAVVLALLLFAFSRFSVPRGVRFVGENLVPIRWSQDATGFFCLQMPVKDSHGNLDLTAKWDRSIYGYDVASGAQTKYRLPSGLPDDYSYAYSVVGISPDGTRSTFAEPGVSNQTDLFASPLGSNAPVRLYRGQPSKVLWLTTDLLAFVERGRLYTLDCRNFKTRPVLGSKVNTHSLGIEVSSSADGHLLLWTDNQMRYFVCDVPGGQARALQMKSGSLYGVLHLSESVAVLWRDRDNGSLSWFELYDLRTNRSRKIRSSDLFPRDFERRYARDGRMAYSNVQLCLSPDLSKCLVFFGGHYDFPFKSSRLYVVDTPKGLARKLDQFTEEDR